VGPRYCPSLRIKLLSFPTSSVISYFLNPRRLYGRGLRERFFHLAALEVQTALIRTIVGCEQADIVRPAYCGRNTDLCLTPLNLNLV